MTQLSDEFLKPVSSVPDRFIGPQWASYVPCFLRFCFRPGTLGPQVNCCCLSRCSSFQSFFFNFQAALEVQVFRFCNLLSCMMNFFVQKPSSVRHQKKGKARLVVMHQVMKPLCKLPRGHGFFIIFLWPQSNSELDGRPRSFAMKSRRWCQDRL